MGSRMKSVKNNEVYDVGTRVRVVSDFHTFVGTISVIKVIKIPHKIVNDYVMYYIKTTDNHYEWVNSRYAKKLECDSNVSN
jgi:hypothetical protein